MLVFEVRSIEARGNVADQHQVQLALLSDLSDLTRFGLPLLLAIVLGGLVGLEREVHGRPAGLRTHILVCVCSTMLVYASHIVPLPFREQLLQLGPDSARIVLDPNRLAAGIVQGIGFLGAASVLRAGDMVRGVTTAACIWFVAGLGIVIGNGAYGIAISATLAVLLGLLLLGKLSQHLPEVVYRQLHVQGHGRDMQEVGDGVRSLLESIGVRTQDVSGSLSPGGGDFELVFHLRLTQRPNCAELLAAVGDLEGVRGVEWRSVERE